MKGVKLYKKAEGLIDKLFEKNSLSDKAIAALYKEYCSLLRKAAYLGLPEAQFDLGQQYENMTNVSLHNPNYNPKKCVYWYTMACNNNHGDACNTLAFAYETGQGCRKDLRKALSLYKKSAELGKRSGKEKL